jgi:hypothetical protein
MKCRLCNKGPLEIGGYLQRVNPKGETGIWECRPCCEADLPQETNLLLALEQDDEQRIDSEPSN